MNQYIDSFVFGFWHSYKILLLQKAQLALFYRALSFLLHCCSGDDHKQKVISVTKHILNLKFQINSVQQQTKRRSSIRSNLIFPLSSQQRFLQLSSKYPDLHLHDVQKTCLDLFHYSHIHDFHLVQEPAPVVVQRRNLSICWLLSFHLVLCSVALCHFFFSIEQKIGRKKLKSRKIIWEVWGLNRQECKVQTRRESWKGMDGGTNER